MRWFDWKIYHRNFLKTWKGGSVFDDNNQREDGAQTRSEPKTAILQ